MNSFRNVEWQAEPTPAFLRDLVGRDEAVVLEIGSNDGRDSTEVFVEAFPAGKIICFEPDQRAISRFRKSFGNLPNVELVEVAIGDINGDVPWYASHGEIPEKEIGKHVWPEGVESDWDLSGSICEPTGHMVQSPWVTFSRGTETVPCRRLDDWFTERTDITTIDFIWADVQGAERRLIEGGKRALNKTRFLYTEFYDQRLSWAPYDLPEMYRGQPTLGEIMLSLPGWTVRSPHRGGNILLENCKHGK